MQDEIWRPIPGYEGYYDISNLGRVKALPRPKRTKWGNFFMLRESFKKSYPQSDGYLQIGLSRDGVKTSFLLHRLVGQVFVSGDTSLEINHKDFDRTNNRATNLEWATRLENVDYSFKNDRYQGKHARGLTKLQPIDVWQIRRYEGLIPAKTLAQAFRISSTQIKCIWKRRYWRSVA